MEFVTCASSRPWPIPAPATNGSRLKSSLIRRFHRFSQISCTTASETICVNLRNRWTILSGEAFEEVADQPRRGQSEDPGPDDSFHDRPSHSAKPFHCADAHDRCRDDVRS